MSIRRVLLCSETGGRSYLRVTCVSPQELAGTNSAVTLRVHLVVRRLFYSGAGRCPQGPGHEGTLEFVSPHTPCEHVQFTFLKLDEYLPVQHLSVSLVVSPALWSSG